MSFSIFNNRNQIHPVTTEVAPEQAAPEECFPCRLLYDLFCNIAIGSEEMSLSTLRIPSASVHTFRVLSPQIEPINSEIAQSPCTNNRIEENLTSEEIEDEPSANIVAAQNRSTEEIREVNNTNGVTRESLTLEDFEAEEIPNATLIIEPPSQLATSLSNERLDAILVITRDLEHLIEERMLNEIADLFT